MALEDVLHPRVIVLFLDLGPGFCWIKAVR